MKLVKCKLCEKYFDREKEPFVRIGARYAHKTCQEKKEEDTLKENVLEENTSVEDMPLEEDTSSLESDGKETLDDMVKVEDNHEESANA